MKTASFAGRFAARTSAKYCQTVTFAFNLLVSRLSSLQLPGASDEQESFIMGAVWYFIYWICRDMMKIDIIRQTVHSQEVSEINMSQWRTHILTSSLCIVSQRLKTLCYGPCVFLELIWFSDCSIRRLCRLRGRPDRLQVVHSERWTGTRKG